MIEPPRGSGDCIYCDAIAYGPLSRLKSSHTLTGNLSGQASSYSSLRGSSHLISLLFSSRPRTVTQCFELSFSIGIIKCVYPFSCFKGNTIVRLWVTVLG